MSDDWLAELRQMHEADKAKREAEEAQAVQAQAQQSEASRILRQSQAHRLLRDLQKALLGGGGALEISDKTAAYGYEWALLLIWQGPISAARRPNPNDPEPYNYILVGTTEGDLYVNHKKLPATTPNTLKAALLRAAKKPLQQKPG